MAKPFQALLLRDVAQPPYFWTVSPKGNKKKSDFTWSRVCQLLPQVYEPAEHKICVSPFTQNGPLSWFLYGFLLFAYATTLFSCSIAWNWSSYWHWWLLCPAACPASRDINCRWLHQNLAVPFFHFLSQAFLDKALPEKPMLVQVGLFCTSNLSSCTALQQDFMIHKVGSKHLITNNLAAVQCPLCLIFFICSDHIWNQSYWSLEYPG